MARLLVVVWILSGISAAFLVCQRKLNTTKAGIVTYAVINLLLVLIFFCICR